MIALGSDKNHYHQLQLHCLAYLLMSIPPNKRMHTLEQLFLEI